MKLEKLYSFLVQQPKNRVCKHGFTNPHSYRGYYDELAFEPADDVTIEHMLDCCNRAVSETFIGWKGGEFTYDKATQVHVASQGCVSATEYSFPAEILMSIAGLDD